MARQRTIRRLLGVCLFVMTMATSSLAAFRTCHIALASRPPATATVAATFLVLPDARTARRRPGGGEGHCRRTGEPESVWCKRTGPFRPAARTLTTTTTAKATPIDVTIDNNVTATTPETATAHVPFLMAALPPTLKTWLDVSLPEGRCMGVSAGDGCFPVDDNDGGGDSVHHGTTHSTQSPDKHHQWMQSAFHPSEVEYGMTLKKLRSSFWLGRLALRLALDFPDYPILKDSYGRPQLTSGVYGSISHKQDRGIALVSPVVRLYEDGCEKRLAGIGIDLEWTSRPGRPNVASRVLTESERQALGGIPGISEEEEVLLRFSLKEAIYKAAHPLLCQYVSFQEAEVTPFPDGTASCHWLLKSNADKRIAKLTAHWRKLADDGYFLTSASVYENVMDHSLPR